jgi:hypothetical protein
MEAFNARYPGRRVRVTLGVHGVFMGAILTTVNPAGTLEVAVRWAISTGTVK